MNTISFPKDGVKITETGNRVYLDLFALTDDDKKQFNELLYIGTGSISGISDQELMAEVKNRFEPEDIIYYDSDISISWDC